MTAAARGHRAELMTLAAALRAEPVEAAPSAQQAEQPPPPGTEEIQRVLDSLGSLLAKEVAAMNEAVTDHPWASVAAAFLLGLCAGRLLPKA